MKIHDSIALVTGANRGLGRALVASLLERGARRVHAAVRDLAAAEDVRALDPERVRPLVLDVTDPAQISAAALAASEVDLLVNNAGSLASYAVLGAAEEAVRRDFEVNFWGVLALARAFEPVLARAAAAGGAAIVNVLSVASLASMPALGGYSASKAAAWSLTQSLRGELAPRGIQVYAAFPGPIDTDMIRTFDMPKTSAAGVARGILAGVEAGTLDIAPDPMSTGVLATWKKDPDAVAQQFARSGG